MSDQTISARLLGGPQNGKTISTPRLEDTILAARESGHTIADYGNPDADVELGPVHYHLMINPLTRRPARDEQGRYLYECSS